ncbi:MAG: high-potential iron-sulfur protein [Nevskiales bacterium]|nr:high-potential iron-sulfur protein [Nevskiales bacterium]
MTQSHLSRRAVLRGIATGFAALPLLQAGQASAQDAAILSETDPAAQGLGYVADASKIDAAKEPAYKAGSVCDGCALYQAAQAKDGHAPCAAFPGKLVAATGWCRAFAPKA